MQTSQDKSTFEKLALFLDVERGHLQAVRYLVSAGVYVDSQDHSGQSSLHRATRQISAYVDSGDYNGNTPWRANATSQNESVLKVLIRSGADPNVQDPQGITELYMAACKGRTEYVKFLLKMGANPDIGTEFNWKPIHWAAHEGHFDTVKALIDAGCDVSAISDQDLTPLDLAIKANQVDVISLLNEAGAKRSIDIKHRPSSKTHDQWKSRTYDNTQTGSGRRDGYKLSLMFDIPFREPGISFPFGQFVYAVKQPGDKLVKPYQISQLLDTVTDMVLVRRAESRVKMNEYPLPAEKFLKTDILYSITRVTQDYQELKLEEYSSGSGIGTVTIKRDWTGSWKTYREIDGTTPLLFRINMDWSVKKDAGARWLTDDGTLLARTVAQENMLTFEPHLDEKTQDILVGTWISKIWAEQVSAHLHAKILDL